MFAFHLDEVDSTQNEVQRKFHIFRDCKDAVIVVSADRQISGKGREGRSWVSAGECVAVSFAFILPKNNWHAASLGAVLALAADAVLTEIIGEPIDGIKWPNDLILKGCKIGGVISEIVKFGEVEIVVLGIGINLNVEKKDLPERPVWPAASIKDYYPALSTTAQKMREATVEKFKKDLLVWKTRGFSAFHGNLNSRIVGLGEENRIGDMVGEICGVNEEGTLLFKTKDGVIHHIVSGEILK